SDDGGVRGPVCAHVARRVRTAVERRGAVQLRGRAAHGRTSPAGRDPHRRSAAHRLRHRLRLPAVDRLRTPGRRRRRPRRPAARHVDGRRPARPAGGRLRRGRGIRTRLDRPARRARLHPHHAPDPFDNAATALLPALVGREALGSANARLMTGQRLAGGLLGGPVVPLLLTAGAAAPFAVDAATYLLAAALVATLRTPAPDRAPRPAGSTLRREIADGLRTLVRDRALRGLCTATALCNVGMGALIATLVVLVTDWLGAGNTGYAVALTAYAA